MRRFLLLAAALIGVASVRASYCETSVLPELPALESLSLQTIQLPAPKEPISYTFNGIAYRYLTYYVAPGLRGDLTGAPFVKIRGGKIRLVREFQ